MERLSFCCSHYWHLASFSHHFIRPGRPRTIYTKSPDSCSVFVFASSTSALHSSLSFLALASHTSTATANQWEHRNDDNIGLMAVSLCDNMTQGRTNSFSSCYGHSWWLWRGNWRSVDVLLRPAQHVCYQWPAVHKFVFCVFYCVFDYLAARCSEIKFIYIKWYRRRTLNEPRLAHAVSLTARKSMTRKIPTWSD